MKTILSYSLLLASFTSATVMACGGVVYLDQDPARTADAAAPVPQVPGTDSGPSQAPPDAAIDRKDPPSSALCGDTPRTLVNIPSARASALSVGNGYLALVTEPRGPTLPPVPVREVRILNSDGKLKTVASTTGSTGEVATLANMVYFPDGGAKVLAYDLTLDTTTEVADATALQGIIRKLAVTPNGIFMALEGTSPTDPSKTTFAQRPFPGARTDVRTLAEVAGTARSLSARGDEWGAVLADGNVAHGWDDPSTDGPAYLFVSRGRAARGTGIVTSKGFFFQEKPACAGCNQAKVVILPPANKSSDPERQIPFDLDLSTTIHAFSADEAGFAIHGEATNGTELRALQTIVTHGGVGSTYTTRVGDTIHSAVAIGVDTSCVYWLENDNFDPSPSAESVNVRSVKRVP